jgi:ABC-2 type transport system ATP-binding protein
MVEKCSANEANVQPAIVLNEVRKNYGGPIDAVRGLSLLLQPNEIFCLVGPNGAGKTTLLRMMGTQLEPTSGSIHILGFDAVLEASQVRRHLAVVPQEATTDPDLTPFEHVYFYLRARGQRRREARENADDTLRLVGLEKQKKTSAVELSGGLRRRVLLAMVIATGARVMLLDEPTTKLDPLARRQIWHDLTVLKKGRTVLLTTHSMEEAEAIADRIAILHHGAILATGTLEQLRDKLTTKHKIYVEDGQHGNSLGRFGRVEQSGGKLVLYPQSDRTIDDVVHFAVLENLPISVLPTTLEDVYVHLVEGAS